MILHIKAIEAKDVPKMDFIGKSDPFLKFTLNTSSQEYRTKTIKKTLAPVWHEEIHIPITSEMNDLLHISLYDEDKISKSDLISTRDFPVSDFPIGKVIEDWYDFSPNPKLAKKSISGGKVRLIFHLANSGDEPFIGTSSKPVPAITPTRSRETNNFEPDSEDDGDSRYNEYPESSLQSGASQSDRNLYDLNHNLRNITKQIKSKSNGKVNPINFCYVDRLISVRGYKKPIAISLNPSKAKLSSYGVYIYDTTRLQSDKALYLFVGPNAHEKTEKFGQNLLNLLVNETKCNNVVKIIRNTNSPDFQNMIQRMGGNQGSLDKSKQYGDELIFQLNFFSSQFHNHIIVGDTISPRTSVDFDILPPKCVDIIDNGDFSLYVYVDNANPSSDAERQTQVNAINYICSRPEFRKREVIVFDKTTIPACVQILCSKK